MRKFFAILALLAFTACGQESSVFESHPWKGARVAFLGDSITDPNVTPGSHRDTPSGHDWTGIKDNHYWGYLQKWLGIKPLVYGVNGRQWDDVLNQAEQLKAEHGDDFDSISIFLGTNDYNSGLPLGEWYDIKDEKVISAQGNDATEYEMARRIPSMDGGTFKGRINIAVSALKSMFPDKQIVILTPVHRAYATFGSKNIQPEESYPNTIGLYIHDYVDALKEVSDIWSVPVIDLFGLSGLYPMMKEQDHYISNPETDRLHPSAKGHERIAKTLLYQLSALPCSF